MSTTAATDTSTIGTVPQSEALAEATGNSLGELMSRDPEGYSKQDRGSIVAAMRAQRLRMEQNEKAAPAKAPKAAKSVAAAKASTANPEDLGF